MSRYFAVVLGALTLSGCLGLDGFLYSTKRIDGYAFAAAGEIPEETVTPEQIEPLEIPVDDDTMGAVYVRAAQQPPRAYVLYFQGQGGNIVNAFPRIKRLVNMGYDVLAVDYRGWGASTNIAPNEETIQRDAREALRFMLTRAPTGKLLYYGRSFGAAVATYLATEPPEPPAALILESPFASVEAIGEDSSSLPLPREFYSKSEWNNVERVRELDTALLLLHGTDDDYVRIEFSEQIFEAAKDPKKLVAVEGANHGDVVETMGANYAQTVQDWVNSHLP